MLHTTRLNIERGSNRQQRCNNGRNDHNFISNICTKERNSTDVTLNSFAVSTAVCELSEPLANVIRDYVTKTFNTALKTVNSGFEDTTRVANYAHFLELGQSVAKNINMRSVRGT